MSKVGCLGCVMALDCSLPRYCGNRVIPDPEIRKKVNAWIHSSLGSVKMETDQDKINRQIYEILWSLIHNNATNYSEVLSYKTELLSKLLHSSVTKKVNENDS